MQQTKSETVHDWVEKGNPLELCTRLKWDNSEKWYIQKPEYIQENKTTKFSKTFIWNKWNPQSQTENQTHFLKQSQIKMSASGLNRSSRSPSKDKKKKNWEITETCQKVFSLDIMGYEVAVRTYLFEAIVQYFVQYSVSTHI